MGNGVLKKVHQLGDIISSNYSHPFVIGSSNKDEQEPFSLSLRVQQLNAFGG